MSPKTDNQKQSSEPDVTVEIPHEQNKTAPTTAPPLPIQPVEPASPPEPITTIPELHEEIHEHEGSRWPVITVYVVLAILVAAMVVFGARWIYQKVTQNPKETKPVSTGQGQAPSLPPASGQKPSSTPASGAAENQAAQPAAGGRLPNNGPGDIVALFVGTVLVVGGLHFIYNLRKQN